MPRLITVLATFPMVAVWFASCHPTEATAPSNDIDASAATPAASDSSGSPNAVVKDWTAAFEDLVTKASNCGDETCTAIILKIGSLQHQVETAGRVADDLEKMNVSDPSLKAAVQRFIASTRVADRAIFSRLDGGKGHDHDSAK